MPETKLLGSQEGQICNRNGRKGIIFITDKILVGRETHCSKCDFFLPYCEHEGDKWRES